MTRRQIGIGVISAGLALVSGCLGSDGHDESDAYRVEIIDRSTDEAVADYHGQWHGELPSIPLGKHISLGARFADNDSNEIHLDERDYQFDVHPSDDDGEVISTESHGDHVHVHGETSGEASVYFELAGTDHGVWITSNPIEIAVIEA